MTEPTDALPQTPGHHDLGGLRLGPIDRDEHPRTLYEMRVDAMLMLLTNPACGAFKVDALRRAIENYTASEYETLPYYDRWMKAIRQLLVEQGVLTDAQIDARIALLRERRAAAGAAS
jgi:nitrile hydratase